MYFIKYREVLPDGFSSWTWCWVVGLENISKGFPYPAFQTNILKYKEI